MKSMTSAGHRNGGYNNNHSIPSMMATNNTLPKNNGSNNKHHIMFATNTYHSQPIIANHLVPINSNGNNNSYNTNINGNNNITSGVNKYNYNNNNNNKYLDLLINFGDKRLFYALLVGLGAIALFNLAITFWIIHILKLSDTGLGYGSVVLTKKGIHVDRDVAIDGTLYARQIRTTDPKETLTFDSLDDEKLVLRNHDIWDNSLTLGDGKLEVQANNFQIRSTNPDDLADDSVDDILFNVEPGVLELRAKDFLQPSMGGHSINTSFETSSIRGHLYHDLRLESRTQQVLINAHKDIYLESRGGDILSQSYDNTVLTANEALRLQSRRLEFKNLPKFDKPVDELNAKDAYQLCICESGQLFAVPADSVCKADAHSCRTRITDDK